MHAAAILGPGNVSRSMLAFQRATKVDWTSLIEQADVIVIFGGDGTIHRHLSMLVDLDIPVLVVPCGSGNDFARALGIRNLRDSLKAWQAFLAHGHARGIDLGMVRCSRNPTSALGERYFSCVAGVGVDSAITRRANSLPRWLRTNGGYALSACRELLHFAPFPVKVSINGTVGGFRPTILAAVANTPAYGGGMKIAPQAKVDDGKLDVCVVRAMETFKVFCLFPTVYFGRHLGLKVVEYAQTSTVRIETEYPAEVYADGEQVCQTPAEFSVAERALKVLMPR
jgi:diacylglycerol kinase (ATP)